MPANGRAKTSELSGREMPEATVMARLSVAMRLFAYAQLDLLIANTITRIFDDVTTSQTHCCSAAHGHPPVWLWSSSGAG